MPEASVADAAAIAPILVSAWSEAQAGRRGQASDLLSLSSATGQTAVSLRLLPKPGEREALLSALQGIGATDIAASGTMVHATLDVSQLPALTTLPGLASATPELVFRNAGAVTSQGHPAMETDDFEAKFRADGTGVTIGIISDSFDTDTASTTDYADDIATGDLPAGVTVLSDLSETVTNVIDEGRAMAQLIHDVAPGAALAFHTGFPNAGVMVDAIGSLAAISDIVVDDLGFFLEPIYMDGQIAQAVDAAFAAGVAYFSSAGNSGDHAYESAYRSVDLASYAGPENTLVSALLAEGYETAHDFDPGGAVNLTQRVTLQPGQSLAPVLQWASPFASAGTAGATSDLDFYVFEEGTTSYVAAGTAANIGADAVEVPSAVVSNSGTAAVTYEIVIANFDGADPERIFTRQVGVTNPVDFSSPAALEFATASGTSFGHPGAEGGMGIGAAPYFATPDFGTDPAILENFSSRGGVPILFEADGTPIAPGDPARDRQRVDIVAPDGTDTTFFGVDTDGTGFPNFFGTSAASPHAAAAAALLLEIDPTLTPDEIYDALRASALPMLQRFTSFGANPVAADAEWVGAGYIDPEAALRLLVDVQDGGTDADSLDGGADVDVLLGGAGEDTLSGGGGDDRLIGGADADRLEGEGGDDTLFGDGGDDTLDGGADEDTAVYDGLASAFTLSGTAASATISGAEGTDLLLGVERVRFDDTTVSLAADDFADSVATSGVVIVDAAGETGTLEQTGDRDWFAVSLLAGVPYLFDQRGSASGGGTLVDPSLALRDASGGLLASADGGGVGGDARLLFTASTSGLHYLDAGGAGGDAAGTYTVEAARNLPNLTPSDLSLSTATWRVGETVTLTHTVANTGPAAAAASTTAFYASTDATVTPADTALGTDALGPIAAGGTGQGTFDYTVALAPGTYHVGFAADGTGAIAELDEADNLTGSPGASATSRLVTVIDPLPDLTASGLGLDDTLWVTGDQIGATWTISNTGTAAAGPFDAGLYISLDSDVTTDDTLFASVSVAGLAAGASLPLALSEAYGGGLAPGTYHAALISDPDDAVDESDEAGNRSASVEVTVASAPSRIGEAGSLSFSQPGPAAWTQVAFSAPLEDPSVVVGPLGFNGGQAAAIRVRNVTEAGFELQIDEWDFLDGRHTTETVSWLAIEAGTHVLPGGLVLRAGSVLADHDPVEIGLGATFDAAPLAFAQIVSRNDAAAATRRIDDVTRDGFTLRMQEEEAADGIHAIEEVDWIAVELGGSAEDGLLALDGAAVNSVPKAIGFGGSFGGVPALLADMQTFRGVDPATLRQTALDATGTSLFIDEEQSADSETWHRAETVGLLALDPGAVEGATVPLRAIGEAGTVVVEQAGSDVWTSVTFAQALDDPSVVMGPLTFAGTDPATLRVRNVTETGFEFQLDEWDYLDGSHFPETVSFLAIEAGSYTLADGTQIRAGSATGTDGFTRVGFGSTGETPVALAQIVTTNDAAAATTRLRDVTETGFDLLVQEEEAADGVHADEEVDWIVISQGAREGLFAERTADSLTHVAQTFGFAGTFAGGGVAPALLAQMQTFDGPNPAVIRAPAVDAAGATLFVEEEASLDAEVTHTTEVVGIVALDAGTIFA